jgi:pyruvate/2-oxoglutarate dehydrogenase complex dihydrolipoamide acyltransferase (E2) component
MVPKHKDINVKKIPKSHKLIFDMFDLSLKLHHIHVIAQLDIDLVLRLLEQSKEIYGQKISLTGYLIYIFSRAIKKYEDAHAIRVGLKKYIFNDVDVHTIIEREMKDGEKVPTSYIIRQADSKSILEIHNEIRLAQQQSIEGLVEEGSKREKLQRMFSSFPRFLRKRIFKRMLKNPSMMKKNIGTVCVTAVGMLAKDVRTIGMPIPVQPWPIQFSLGCLDKKVQIKDERIIEREILNVTITVDHDIMQGGIITRFLNEIYEMVESGFGLT